MTNEQAISVIEQMYSKFIGNIQEHQIAQEAISVIKKAIVQNDEKTNRSEPQNQDQEVSSET